VKRKYSGTYGSNKIAKIPLKKRYYSKAVGNLINFKSSIPKQIFNQYASRSYKRGEELRLCDFRFTGAYNAGTYTADTEPFQNLTINTTGCIQALSNFQQGVGLANRIGNKASMKSLRIRLKVLATGVAETNLNQMRVIVFYDRQPNGAYLSPTDMISQFTSNNATVAGIWSDNLNSNYLDRIRILKDETFRLPGQTSGGLVNQVGPTEQCAYLIDWFIKCKDLELVYKSTSNPGVIANSTVGSVQILVMGDIAAGSEPWQLNGSARARFYDN